MPIVITQHPIAFERPSGEAPESCGAVVDFWGVVRGDESGQKIAGIEYEAFVEMAEYQLNLLERKAFEDFKIAGLTCIHRIGFVAVGEPSIYVRVLASHRKDAFEATMRFIDELKRIVPIWKHPKYASEL